MKRCCHCKIEREFSAYQYHNGRPSGWCRKCRSGAEESRRRKLGILKRKTSIVLDGNKLCLLCDQMKALEFFSPTPRGLAGVSSYCKVCFKAAFKTAGVDQRIYTASYRKRNLYRWRAMHRLTQFKRKQKIAIQSDGSVTDAVLHDLYLTSSCYLCEKVISSSDRTIDHVIPLVKGGAHSISNLKMACRSCNSKKRDAIL